MTEQKEMHWETDYTLGYDPMDDIHDEFLELLALLQEASDEQLPERLEQMENHLKSHFGEEDSWMEKSEFPPRQCHMDEHAEVLKSVAEVRVLLAEGDTEVCRSLTLALAEWFPGHTSHLDSALAHWMAKDKLKGKPMVFKPMKRV